MSAAALVCLLPLLLLLGGLAVLFIWMCNTVQ